MLFADVFKPKSIHGPHQAQRLFVTSSNQALSLACAFTNRLAQPPSCFEPAFSMKKGTRGHGHASLATTGFSPSCTLERKASAFTNSGHVHTSLATTGSDPAFSMKKGTRDHGHVEHHPQWSRSCFQHQDRRALSRTRLAPTLLLRSCFQHRDEQA